MSRCLPVLPRLIEKSCPIPFSGCLIWTGDCDKDGYGFITVDGKRRLAHRVAYAIAKGEPKNFVCHTCDVPSCINPDHLYDGTNSQNMQDRSDSGRSNHALGERHGRSKLTTAQVVEIRRLFAHGETTRSIAKQFGIKSPGQVSKIVKGQIWSAA